MKAEGSLILGTAREVTEYLLKNSFNHNGTLKSNIFHDCDFAVANDMYLTNYTLEEILINSDGWYGIKRIDAGFDSENMELITDYYGGGCATLTSVMYDEEKNNVINIVEKSILEVLSDYEMADKDTLLICRII